MPRQKAENLAKNHALIATLGGQAAARQQAFSQPTRASKIAFMESFHGIGPKYARNVWMDLYDPDFYDAIAVDERLKKIAEALGVNCRRYVAAEHFFVELANDSGRQPWEADRLLYHFNREALDTMAGRA